jgi:hypothetical protein
MKVRSFICAFVLIAYLISLAHSVLPHRHYSSIKEYQEAVNGSHHDKGHQHDQDNNHEKGENGKELPSSLFFLTHTSNVDFSLSKFSFEQKIKVKIQWPKLISEIVFLSDKYVAESLFHIPDSPLRVDYPTLSSRLLRAPPFIS